MTRHATQAVSARRDPVPPRSRAARLLCRLGGGFGSLPLPQILGANGLLADDRPPAANPDLNGGLHHRAKVKRVMQLFMNGGASPMDTFDYKPRLAELHGQTFDPGDGAKVESVTGSPGFKVLKAPSSSTSTANAAVGSAASFRTWPPASTTWRF